MNLMKNINLVFFVVCVGPDDLYKRVCVGKKKNLLQL